MPFRPFPIANRLSAGGIAHHPFAGLAVTVMLMATMAFRADAGSEMLYPPRRAPLKSSVTARVSPTPTPAPKVKITNRPHLLAVGPTTINIKPVAGPYLRQPPLLPPPKVVEPDPVEPPKAPEPAPAPAVEPSVLEPDAPPVLLPSEKPAATPAPERKTETKDGLLTPSERAEQELRDAVMYFETPVGPNGARVAVPLAAPFSVPSAPQPESRATYRTEKTDK